MFDIDKFNAVGLYVSLKRAEVGQLTDWPTLCNIMWVIDRVAYAELGDSITGATYVKTEDGVEIKELLGA